MSFQNFFKDANGRIIGSTQNFGDMGTQIVKDANGRMIGRYQANTKSLHDASGRIVGYGPSGIVSKLFGK